VSEKQIYQLALVNMADINNDDSIYDDSGSENDVYKPSQSDLQS
jgi:hypothetical protein